MEIINWAIGILLIALGVVGAMMFMGSDSNEGSERISGFAVQSPIKTCRDVRVPYEAIEEYQVQLNNEIVETIVGFDTSGFNYLKTSTVEIINLDSERGEFTVTFLFRTLEDGETIKQQSLYISPGETKEFYHTYDSDLGEDVEMKYRVIPGEKTLTRTVTKFRTEERCS